MLRQPEVSKLICRLRQLTKLPPEQLVILGDVADDGESGLQRFLLALKQIKTPLVER